MPRVKDKTNYLRLVNANGDNGEMLICHTISIAKALPERCWNTTLGYRSLCTSESTPLLSPVASP